MARPKRADWLDRIILEARPGRTPKADFDAWRDAHTGAIRRLREHGAALPPKNPPLTSIARFARHVIRRPITRLAVAAGIIAGILILAAARDDRMPARIDPMPTAADQPTSPRPGNADPAEKELRLANELFVRVDVEGLLVLLQTGQPRTAFAAAMYLGRIGDASSLPTLQTFAAQWQGPAAENPFQNAIDRIHRRLGQNDAGPPDRVQAPIVVVQSAQELPPPDSKNPQLTCRGVVLDNTGVPINGATVWAQSCTKDLRLTDMGTPVRADARGRFSLTAPLGDFDADSQTYLLCRRDGYALGWLRLPADRQTTDFNDCRIILREPTVIAGTVTDIRGHVIPGALVEARIVGAHDPTSMQEYPYVTGNRRAVRTNGAGRFALEDVPEGSLLSLAVSRRGYGSYDSREGYGRLLGTSPYLDPESHTVRAGRRDVKIELISARGGIDGLIVDEHGIPYNGAVALRCEDANRILAGSGYSYSNGHCTLMEVSQRGLFSMDNKGRFRIEDLPVGEYVIAAVDPASGNAVTPVMRTVISKSRPRSTVTLRVGATVDVRVRVRKRTGEPLDNALVVVPGAMTHGYTDPNGWCVLHLVRGDHVIRTYAWACESAETTVRQTYGPTNPPMDFSVDMLPLLHGRLMDETGAPVRGWVRPFLGERVLADPDGRFAMPKRFENHMYPAGDTEGTHACNFFAMASAGGAELEIRLEPVALFLGRILDYDGTPVDDAPVVFDLLASRPDSPKDRYAGLLRCRLFLCDGRFRLEVPVGSRWTLMASSNGYEGQFESVDPAPGQTYDLGDILLQSVPAPASSSGQDF